MSEQKMDFQKWQASAKFDSDDEASELAETYSRKLHILTFGLDRNGTKIISQLNGRIIFVEKDFQYEVGIDETWICSLKEAYNCSYATPIIKLTLNDILNFNEQLRENVLSTLWKKYQNDLKTIFENRYKAELKNMIAEELKTDFEEKLERLTKEKDDIENELRQTRFQLETQRTAAPVVEDDFIILGSNDVVSKKEPVQSVQVQPTPVTTVVATEQVPMQVASGIQSAPGVPRSIPQIKRVGPVAQKFEVERIGPDSLRSPSFTDNRYFVHISPDYKVLVIRPNEDGDVYCLNKVIRLKDLGLVSGYTAKKFLVAEYSELYEGMIVRL